MKVVDFIDKFTGTIDVYDNYTEELGIAYCGEKLTEAGKKHFDKALNLEIDYFNTDIVVIKVDKEGQSEKETEKNLELAKKLFYSIAGYACSDKEWDKWFKSE